MCLYVCSGQPVFGVCDGVDDWVVDGGGLSDDRRDGVHVGSQHVSVPDPEKRKKRRAEASENTHRPSAACQDTAQRERLSKQTGGHAFGGGQYL